MGNFFDLLVFIGWLYKLALAIFTLMAVGTIVMAVLFGIYSFFAWIF